MNARRTKTRSSQGQGDATALRPPPSVLRAQPSARRTPSSRSGMTMIELGIVMGIVTVLLALVLSLGRHVNGIVKIRRAQADLGEWHEALNRWHLQFGEYPYAAIDANGNEETLLNASDPDRNFSNILARAHVQLTTGGSGSTTNITFRSFRTSGVSHIDPWGTPYIYTCDENRKSYTLYSCGPDAHTRVSGTVYPSGAAAVPDPSLDDIYFER